MGRTKGLTDAMIVEKEGGIANAVEIMGTDENGIPTTICGVDILRYKLTKFEVEFVIEYMNNGMNAVSAAMKIFGLKRMAAAKAKAAYLMNNGRVFPLLQLLLKNSVSSSLQYSPALLMTNVQTWLQYDINKYYTSEGDAIPLEEIEEEARQLISGVDYTVNSKTGERYVTYKLPDKYKVLQELSSIVKFLQTLTTVNAEDESDAEQKRKEIFGKYTNHTPEIE